MKNCFLLVILSVICISCANTREPAPISMKSSSDESMTCSQIFAEYRANTDAAAYKISKNKSNDGQDVLLVLFVWPGLADFKNADGVEGNALLDRNLYLRQLADSKGCDISTLPAQPMRYD
jgi:hypothetical protein